MSQETKTILLKRLKSLLWRVSMMAAVALVDFVATSLSLFDLPPIVVTIVGLSAGEVSKYLNTKKPQ